MIISASRRTDIPAFYAPWFFQRLREGFVLVRNPMNPRQVSKIPLNRETVDGFVFWTKNPLPMLPYLDLLKDYPYYFQFTLTPYGPDVEAGLPDKEEVLLPAFMELSRHIGKERVLWRYDPVLLNAHYTEEYHLRRFEEMALLLAPFTEKCIFSFLDAYRKTEKNMAALKVQPFTPQIQHRLAAGFAQCARAYGLKLDTCAEELDLACYGIAHGCCIDAHLLSRLSGRPLSAEKDQNQRPACGCAQSIDIGAYNTCMNGCSYCYATENHSDAKARFSQHDPASALLYGAIGPQDKIIERKVPARRSQQLTFDL